MKRIKSFLTIIMATIFALSLVPAGAFAAGEVADSGVLGTDNGTIIIANPQAGETYSAYRLFELASFTDDDNRTKHHPTSPSTAEAYSYVINYKNTAGTSDNPWLTFLTSYNKEGTIAVNEAKVPYAVYTKTTDNPTAIQATLDTNNDGVVDATEVQDKGAYFLIESDAVTVNGVSTYHVISATNEFQNAWDLPDSASSRADEGVSEDGNVVMGSTTGVIQRFAQEALKYATKSGMAADYTAGPVTDAQETAGDLQVTDQASLGYYLVGTTMGTLASLDTTNATVKIYEKNDEPKIEKDVLKKGSVALAPASVTAAYLTGSSADTNGDSSADAFWVQNTDAGFEDYVQFRTVVTAQQGAKNYVIHDVMENGLAYVAPTDTTTPNSTSTDGYTYGGTSYPTKVYLVREGNAYFVPATTTVTATAASATNYVLTADTSDHCDFEIALKDATVSNATTQEVAYGDDLVQLAVQAVTETGDVTLMDIQDGDKIVVTYWARLVDDQDDVWDTETDNTTDVTSVKSGDANVPAKKYKHNDNGRNDNYTVLTYGAKSYTQWADASVTTYQLDVAKTKPENADSAGNGTYPMLAGAQFSIYKAAIGTDATSFDSAGFTPTGSTDKYYKTSNKLSFTKDITVDPNGNYYSYDGDTATATAAGTVAALTTTATGALNLVGLEAGTYLLYEDVAPTGYNKLSHPIVVTITGDANDNGVGDGEPAEGSLTYIYSANSGANAATSTVDWDSQYDSPNYVTKYDDSDNHAYDASGTDNGGVHVVNQTGQELPSTGGIGTTIFYVAGTVLVVGAAVMLVAKRRMGSEA